MMGGMTIEADWSPLGFGTVTRRQCPECDFHIDEPPMETKTEMTHEGMVMRVRQHSALPAVAMHVILNHPDSATAGELVAAAEAHVAAKAKVGG